MGSTRARLSCVNGKAATLSKVARVKGSTRARLSCVDGKAATLSKVARVLGSSRARPVCVDRKAAAADLCHTRSAAVAAAIPPVSQASTGM
jgi:hypothetical protein